AGFQVPASRLGLAVLCPDTSPRGLSLPGEHSDWSFGAGAGFYLDATEEPWAKHYRMESYVRDELLTLAADAFGLDLTSVGASGHSMGGHGALSLFLRNPGLFKSVSAFAPICNPTQSPWGKKAFEGYLGSVGAGKAHDACELVQTYSGPRVPILVDQGAADEFLSAELMPANFQRACAAAGQPLTLRTHAGYDHSYLFVATFMEEHLRHHAAQLIGTGKLPRS
ncbi:Alpha/Beta hydrolase protein, partial [Pavlovales sp. CCMP2436]